MTIYVSTVPDSEKPYLETDPCRLDRQADALLQQGFATQAERLAHLADAIRAEVAGQ